ncbi:MAG: hypothetical protein ACXVXC_17185 [Nocardioidaceae bacterium]
MITFWTVLLPLAVKSPPPSKVKPGWLAFWIIIALCVAVAFLGMSLRKHLNRVNFEEEPLEEKPQPPANGENGDPSHA